MSEALGLLTRMGADGISALVSALNGGAVLPAIVFVGLAFTLAAWAAATVAARSIAAHPAQRVSVELRSQPRDADLRVLIWQINPDAPGHIRSRAPGGRLSFV
jgi:hypothetical protein